MDFDLKAIICFVGQMGSGGHYVTYGNRKAETGEKPFLFDDEVVRPASFPEATAHATRQRATPPKTSYLLFYERIPEPRPDGGVLHHQRAGKAAEKARVAYGVPGAKQAYTPEQAKGSVACNHRCDPD